MAPSVLSFGGLDPNAGAGILADVRVMAACGVQPRAVASCITVQNREGLLRAETCDSTLIADSLAAVFADGDLAAVKTGMILQVSALESFLGALDRIGFAGPMVVDPVLSVSAGGWQAGLDLQAAMVEQLLPRATVLTPNLPELHALVGGAEASALLDTGVHAVLLKDGHGAGLETMDRLITRDASQAYPRPRLDKGPVHGTGCALASALASYLALGQDLPRAVGSAVDKIQEFLEQTRPAADGRAVNLAIPLPS